MGKKVDRMSVLIHRMDDGNFIVEEQQEDKLTQRTYVVRREAASTLSSAMGKAKAAFENVPF